MHRNHHGQSLKGLKDRIIKEPEHYPILTIVVIMTNRTALAIIAILITPVCASAQQTQFQRIRNFNPATGGYTTPATSAKPASNYQGDDNMQPQDESDANNLAPLSQPSTMPPDTLSRPPLPTANENLALPQLSNPTIRPNLSWRSKAYKLSLEGYDPQNGGKHPNLMMNGSIQDSLNALVQACQTNGLQIIGQSLPAGQLGARLVDAGNGRSVFVFVLKKVADDKTIVKASVEPDSKGKKLILLGDLLNQAASLVDGKGLL